MKYQEDLDRAAASFDRARDALVAIRPFRHGDADAQMHAAFDPSDMDDKSLRRLISTKFVTVLKDGRGKPVPDLLVEAQPAAINTQFACDVHGCDKTYNTKLKLASHGRIHKD
jgi:hypothetical protein